MSDVSTLRMNPAPVPDNSFRSVVSGSDDPDISVDVGMPLQPDPGDPPNGLVFFVNANQGSDDTPNVIGLAYSATEAGKAITVQYAGPMTWPTSRWDAVTGGSGGLTPGAQYYLGATDGSLTTSLDALTWAVPIGVALTPTTLMINIGTPELTSP